MAAFVGLVNVLIIPRAADDPGRMFYVVLVPPLSFALFFALVYPLAYAFPPHSDELRLRAEFLGAPRVVWPIVLLACALVVWLVVWSK